jgi:molybdopterin-guanine dinucleotide biosynthesis protein A
MIENLTAIILAGGKSSRMGEDKGLMSLFGKSMIEYVLEEAKKLTDKVIIIANNSDYKKYGHPVFTDLIPNKGPLGGIYTGLTKSETQQNLILSCDVPFVKKELLDFLWEKFDESDVIIPQKEERIHPLIGFYKKDCTDVLKKQVEKGELKIRKALNLVQLNVVEANQFPAEMFRNINSKKDL